VGKIGSILLAAALLSCTGKATGKEATDVAGAIFRGLFFSFSTSSSSLLSSE
jgi:hypothetical protein